MIHQKRRLRTDDTAAKRDDAGERTRCPECGGRLVADEAHGETACGECGLVVADGELDRGPEWRSFDDEDDRGRVGAPTTELLHDKGLSSVIGRRDVDASGKRISGRKRKRLARMRRWDERFRNRNSADRNLRFALGEIDRMSSALGIPDGVRETAGVVYRRALAEDVVRGRSIEGVATASVYAAARQAHLPRDLDEFANVSRVSKIRIQRAYTALCRTLDLAVPPADPVEYARRYASDLDLTQETSRRARDLLETAVEHNHHSGKNPTALAAGAVYAAANLTNERVTQPAVAEVANVAVPTVRNRYRELLELEDRGST
jgi:transcription initiation factor TFIIB